MFVNFNILNQLGSPAINSNTFANRPAAGQTGRLFVSTDTYEIYRDNGTTWDLIGGPGSSTITGTGTATQVAYFTSSQAIGSSANLFWDNTSGFLGVATATPSARIEAVKTDGVGIYANFTTNAGSGSSTTALWAKNVTNSSGFAAVIEETTPNTTAGQYPLLIKHSLSSGTAGVGMGTGLHFQLPDDAGTFKTTQLTIETINAAAATYATRYRFNVQSNGSSTPVAYINATGVGIFTATPGAALDIHSTGTIAQFNTTSATGNTYVSFQRTGTGLWRVGDTYNGGPNQFEIHNTVLGIDAVNIKAATNKTSWQATENYTSGVARGNYFDYNLTLNPANPLASPNAISAVGASLDLTLQGSIIIPSGARSGLDAYNSISFTTTGTLTHNQGTQIRAYSNLTAGWAFNGSATGTITHLAGLRALFPDNTGSAIAITNNYALLLNDQTANTGTVTYTNRWGVYQEGASDLNYMSANLLLGSTTNNGNKLQVTGNADFTGNVGIGTTSPTAKLHTYLADGANDNRLLIQQGSNGYASAINLLGSNDGGSAYNYISSGTTGGTAMWQIGGGGVSNTMIMYTAGSERMRITSGGNVGIGISSPSAWNGAAGVIVSQYSGSGNSIYSVQSNSTTIDQGGIFEGFSNAVTSGSKALGSIAFLRENTSTTALSSYTGFYTNNAGAVGEQMRITSGGNVGIGTTPSSWGSGTNLEIGTAGNLALHNSSTVGNLIAFNTYYNAGWYYKQTNFALGYIQDSEGHKFYYNGSGTGGTTFTPTERMRITSGGNVLIGTATDAGQKLQVNGVGYFANGIRTGDASTIGPNDQIVLTYGTGESYIYSKSGSALNLTTDATTSKGLRISTSGSAAFTSSISTGTPNGGTSANWKLGTRVAATVALDTTQYIELDVGGTLYKLAIVT